MCHCVRLKRRLCSRAKISLCGTGQGGTSRKKDAILAVIRWLFWEDGDECGYGPSAVVEEVSRNVSPGRYRTEILTKPVPKFSFSSLEEFVLKAETSGDMRAEDSFDSDVRSGRRR